ncbi:MAG: ABC transporter ATP-binding protein, partial [Pseudomonadota bacterium]
MTARLALDGVAKSFGETLAVRDMSLSLAPGEFVSLLGPSGCGKSTTLAMVAGFETPTRGTILIDGKDVSRRPPGKRAIGLVFQDYAVFSRLSVRGNLLFGLEAQGVGRAERKRRFEAIVERLDLGHLLNRRGANLNMSEMQRVALARVLVTEPLLLLLDEPMSNLDAAIRERLRTELKALQQDLGQTVLYVTHDQVEAMAMSDRIAVMNDGVIEQIGTPEDIYHRPATRFVAEFIGDPPINPLPSVVSAQGNRLMGGSPMNSATKRVAGRWRQYARPSRGAGAGVVGKLS